MDDRDEGDEIRKGIQRYDSNYARKGWEMIRILVMMIGNDMIPGK